MKAKIKKKVISGGKQNKKTGKTRFYLRKVSNFKECKSPQGNFFLRKKKNIISKYMNFCLE